MYRPIGSCVTRAVRSGPMGRGVTSAARGGSQEEESLVQHEVGHRKRHYSCSTKWAGGKRSH
jgi:hypothetical protein